MPVYRDDAIILRTHLLGEADRIITMLSRDHGKVRAVAKGVRKTGSKFGARLEPFMRVDVQLYEGKSLDVVSQVETINAFGADIVANYASFTAANAMVEVVDKLVEAEPARMQYHLLTQALKSLASLEHAPQDILNSYLLRALAIAGWAPNFVSCVISDVPGPHPFFSVHLGGIVSAINAPAGSIKVTDGVVQLLAALLSGNWAIVDAATEPEKGQASGVIAAYLQYQLDRNIKSLQHLDFKADDAAKADFIRHGLRGR